MFTIGVCSLVSYSLQLCDQFSLSFLLECFRRGLNYKYILLGILITLIVSSVFDDEKW